VAIEFVQQDGIAMVQMEIRVSDTDTIPLTGTEVILQRAEVNESCDQYTTAAFHIQSATRDYVDKLLSKAQSAKTPRMRWRIGIGTPEGAAEWMPWQEHIIRRSAHAIEGLGTSTGYMTILYTADLLWEIDRINRVMARKGKISEIVQQIADFHSLPYVVEPTVTTGLYYQSYTSDYEFVRDRMVPRAINDKKRGNYQFFLRDGTLHFHTIDYQADLKTFVYYGSPGYNLSMMDNTQEAIDAGAAGVRVVFNDPYTGESGSILASPDNTLILGNTSPDLVKLSGAEKNILVTLGTNREIDPTSLATNTFEAAKSGVYSLSLQVPKTIFFRANDLCNIIIQPDSGQVPPTSGTYQVHTIKHIVDNSSIESEVLLRRGEFLTKDSTHTELVHAGEAVLQPKQSAPGQSPNFKSVATSAITKGTGKQMSRTVVLDTLNPKAAIG
jgi:hypothetical protein